MVGLFNHCIHHHHVERTSPQWWGCQMAMVRLSNRCIHHHHVERKAPQWWGCQMAMVGLSNRCIHQQCRKDSPTLQGLNFLHKLLKKIVTNMHYMLLKHIYITQMGMPEI